MTITIRCAIYTRKSTEEGLEQQFNSLDNQRLAGENYIKSQAANGWEIVPKRYDDGGYSGKNAVRPAFQELLRDIEAGLIDFVVVYKIDRLSRNQMDFLQTIALFDKYKVSFVAVTQAFDTSTPMGRMMLSLLLCFAQFEREITVERLKDKIAESKRQGYWMGGYTPLGYDTRNKELVINEAEAENVREIFDKFLELKSITSTLDYVKDAEIKSKSGQQFSKKTLRQILENPIYKGYVRHKELEYKGRHEAIIDEKIFQKVQDTFKKLGTEKPYKPTNALLEGLIRCGCCDCAMTYNSRHKGNKEYSYYTCSTHIRKKNCVSANRNLPAGDVEGYVIKAVRKILKNPAITACTVYKLDAAGISLDVAQNALKNLDQLWDTLHLQEQQRLIKLLIKNVVVSNNGFKILLNPEGIHELIRDIT